MLSFVSSLLINFHDGLDADCFIVNFYSDLIFIKTDVVDFRYDLADADLFIQC